MAGNPFLQNLDPYAVPDPVTPAASPSDPEGFASVTPHGQGPAPYNIQDPAYTGGGLQAEVTAAFDGSIAVGGAGVLYPMGPRQAESAQMLNSPQGFSAGGGTSGYDITAGWSGGGGDSGWPNNPQPGILETPIQGQAGAYPQSNTGTD